jgi:putative membrane protein
MDKVQAVILSTNPLMRFFGWFILEVQTMGVEGSNHRTAVPLARRSEVLALAQRIRPLALPETFERVSTLTIRRAVVRFSVVLALLVGTAGLVGGLFVERLFWHGAYWGALAWPLVPLYAYLRYRNMGYAFSEEGLLVRRGVLRQRIWLLPTEKQQVFYTTASLFQRRLDLKTLYLDTAGASGLASPEVVDLPAGEADRRLRQLYARFRDHFDAAPPPAPADG